MATLPSAAEVFDALRPLRENIGPSFDRMYERPEERSRKVALRIQANGAWWTEANEDHVLGRGTAYSGFGQLRANTSDDELRSIAQTLVDQVAADIASDPHAMRWETPRRVPAPSYQPYAHERAISTDKG